MSLKANLCSYPNIFRAPSTRPVRVTIGFVTIAKTLVIVFETYVPDSNSILSPSSQWKMLRVGDWRPAPLR